jgi:hypothetical protein
LAASALRYLGGGGQTLEDPPMPFCNADAWKKLAASRVGVLAAHDASHKGHNHGLKDHE